MRESCDGTPIGWAREWRPPRDGGSDLLAGLSPAPRCLADSVPVEDFQNLGLGWRFVGQIDVSANLAVNDAHSHAFSLLIQARNVLGFQLVQDGLPLYRRVHRDFVDINHAIVNRDLHGLSITLRESVCVRPGVLNGGAPVTGQRHVSFLG